MASGYSAIEDVVNAALREVGYAKPVSEIYEGSRASRVALEVYRDARDFLLQQHDWDFALREAALAATVGGTLILGFTYEYNYPSDALRIRQVHIGIPVANDPQPIRWLPGTDATLATKVIFTTAAAAKAVYTAQIVNPIMWNPAFTRAFVNLLARIFAFALGGGDGAQLRAKISDQVTMEAANVGDGRSPIPPELLMRAAAMANRQ